MSLSEADLQELYRRAQLAQNSGYTVARGEDYAALLGGSDGSPAGLIQLCEAALPTLRQGGDGSAAALEGTGESEVGPEAPAPEPPPGEAPVEPEVPVEAPADSTPVEGAPALDAPLDEILEEVAADEAPSDSPEYEKWSRKQLVAEADTKGIEVKSSMSKGDIIAALRASAAG